MKSSTNLVINNALTIENFDFTNGALGLKLADAGNLADGTGPAINYGNGLPNQIFTGDDSNNALGPLGGSGALFNVTVFGQGGDDFLFAHQASEGNHQFFGGAGADLLEGALGHDQLWGEAGRDILFGHAGDDVLDGGDDLDVLFGNEGEDVLDGGAGDDSLSGGGGTDVAEKKVPGVFSRPVLNDSRLTESLFYSYWNALNNLQSPRHKSVHESPLEQQAARATS